MIKLRILVNIYTCDEGDLHYRQVIAYHFDITTPSAGDAGGVDLPGSYMKITKNKVLARYDRRSIQK